jgi:hypothetical protein
MLWRLDVDSVKQNMIYCFVLRTASSGNARIVREFFLRPNADSTACCEHHLARGVRRCAQSDIAD